MVDREARRARHRRRQPVTTLTDLELVEVGRLLTDAGVEVTGGLTATLIAGGRSNLTFRIEDSSSRWVLRMPPRAGRTPSAHDVAREHRVTTALVGTEVPVAAPVLMCANDSVLGGPFTVAEFVTGRTIQSRGDLESVPADLVGGLMDGLVEALAALHRVDHVAVGLAGFGRPDGYAERQLRRWSGQWDLVGIADLGPIADEVLRRLAKNLPTQHAVGVVHGDFRIDNTIVELSGRATIAAVVDWELSTIGDPVADVAMMCAYRNAAFDLVVGAPSAWASPAVPNVDRLTAMYQGAGGVELRDWALHLALANYKIAVIAAGIDHRFRVGMGIGPGFDSAAGAVAPYLEAALGCLEVRA